MQETIDDKDDKVEPIKKNKTEFTAIVKHTNIMKDLDKAMEKLSLRIMGGQSVHLFNNPNSGKQHMTMAHWDLDRGLLVVLRGSKTMWYSNKLT